jgi:plastocyanin
MRKPGINMTLGTLLLVVAFGISGAALWGGAQLVKEEKTASANGAGGPVGGPVALTIVAQNLQFDLDSIRAGAGVPVTVTLDNQDSGVLHNIAFYTNRTASSPIHVGGIITGVATEDVAFNAPSTPGSYYFRCDVHPDTMDGTFSVQ